MFTRTMGALSRKRQALGGSQRGFTLIELLVVVLIIGVLAAVAIPIFLGQQDGARDSAVSAHITQAKTAMAVEIAEGATATEALATANSTEGLESFSESEDIPVVFAARGTDGFTITGHFGDDATASASNNGHTITDDTAAVKMVPAAG